MIDISRSISSEAAVYEGDDPLEIETICEIGEDAPCRITALKNWTTHFLTHVDAPRHFISGGATLDDIPLERFSGEAIVIDVKDAREVLPEHLPEVSLTGLNILFRTFNSTLDASVFHEDHAFVSAAAAQALVSRGANLIGIDYLSVDRFGDEEYPAHRTALGGDVLIMEGLDLSQAAPGRYRLHAFPMKIAGGDGSPVRAVLEEL